MRLNVGFTPQGIQVWCVRHDINVMHMDFEGIKHPANTNAVKNTKKDQWPLNYQNSNASGNAANTTGGAESVDLSKGGGTALNRPSIWGIATMAGPSSGFQTGKTNCAIWHILVGYLLAHFPDILDTPP